MLYVTHSMSEAIALGSRLFLLEHGRIVDSGTPDEVKQRRPEFFAHSAMEGAAETRAA